MVVDKVMSLFRRRVKPGIYKLSYTAPPKTAKTIKRQILEIFLLGLVIYIVMFLIVLIMYLLGVDVSKAEAEAIHGDKPARGWFWYEDPVKTEDGEKSALIKAEGTEDREQKKEEAPKPNLPPKIVEEFEFPVLDTAPPLMKKFLKEPTEESAKEYLAWQFKYMQHLKKIGFTLRDVYLRLGGEIYPIEGYPETPIYSSIYFNKLRDDTFKQIISRFSSLLGIIYFYSKSCPICEQQKDNIVLLRDKYNLSLRGITVDGEIDYNLPFVSTYNPAFIRDYRITQVPALIAVLDKNGEAKTAGLSAGYASVDMIERQLLRFLINEGMIEEKELNPIFISKGQ